jgi:hypothetical protein
MLVYIGEQKQIVFLGGLVGLFTCDCSQWLHCISMELVQVFEEWFASSAGTNFN